MSAAEQRNFPLPEPVLCTVTATFSVRRRRDQDNLTGRLKAMFDALKDARIILDDHMPQFRINLRDPKFGPAVGIHVALTGAPIERLL